MPLPMRRNQFLCAKEQFQILAKYDETIQAKVLYGDEEDLQTVLNYSHRANLPELAKQCHKRLALNYNSLEDNTVADAL